MKFLKYLAISFFDLLDYYHQKKIHNILKTNNFFKIKVFKFPFTTCEDRIYIKKNEYSRASS